MLAIAAQADTMIGALSTFCDHRCHLGEGPMAHPGSGRMFWFDIKEQHLLERPYDGERTRIRSLPMMASAAAVIDDKRLALATEHGLYAYDLDDERMTLLAPIEADNRVTRSNDARVHPCGAFWFGTMGKHAESKAGSVWWLFRGEVKRLFSGIGIINSIAFSADGTTGYFADSAERVIWRVALDPRTGLPQGDRQIFIRFGSEAGGPDGSVVDQDGCLWNARWGGGAVDVYAADGQRIASHAVSMRQPTCPAFAGPGAQGLIVTSAYQDLDEAGRRDDPLAGATVRLPVAVRGRFDPPIDW